MGRRKQAQPQRSGRVLDNVGSSEETREILKCNETLGCKEEVVDTSRFVEIDKSYWMSEKHLDIAEVIVTDTRPREGLLDRSLTEDCYRDSKLSFRFRLRDVDKYSERIRLGHWPLITAGNIFLELLDTSRMEDNEKEAVIFSGTFDGPDDGVSGLVHLVSQEMLMVRPVMEVKVLEDILTLTMRVEILKSAFDACKSLLENTRQPWRKSMVSVMAWLRPEVTTQETIYGIDRLEIPEHDTQMEMEERHIVSKRNIRFSAADLYEAIKPSKDAPMLEDELPDLLPELRPYQRRAAYWMVKREKGMFQNLGAMGRNEFLRPLCVPVDFLYSDSRMFYNPFSGSISLLESCAPYVSGGILADEMGLGKTVELLACIFAHRKSISDGTPTSELIIQAVEGHRNDLKRVKIERVECICGAVTESLKYKGIWVQCDICDAWQHADCVGYSPERKSSNSQEVSRVRGLNKITGKSRKQLRKKYATNIVEMDGLYICQLCSELIQASHSPINTGATLIVCPSPILHQWQAEIIRHTRPGSLKLCVYEGVRNASLSAAASIDITELVSADIVLTTYEVLKEDLSHDSDRNEGDRRLMRYNKRYPVIPTLLTRIFWWRVCLDEAQMVESNTAAATEMALRLHAKYRWCITGTPIQRRLDDLYGLLRFLNTSPFEIRRWWLEVIKDPYAKRDAVAMEFVHKFFKQIMWRSLKVHVADELQLPKQEESVCWLFFSPIEAHFYQKQDETCSSYARELIKRFKKDVRKNNFQGSQSYDASSDIVLTHDDAAKLLHSLLKLRQACCHPQVGSSGLRALHHSPGLRALHHSPMTMEEILGVLVGKSKIEGEEALRKAVMSLNALAGIAIIKGELPQAVSLYEEALNLAEEHSNDFQLDPLLNIHIHHNLAEIFTDLAGSLDQAQSIECQFHENIERRALKLSRFGKSDERSAKRQKISQENTAYFNFCEGHVNNEIKECDSDIAVVGLKREGGVECDAQPLIPFKARFKMACEVLKRKFLTMFVSKLSQAQQEFRNSHMQVCNALEDLKNEPTGWWLEALNHIEKSKESSYQFISKVDDTLFRFLSSSKQSRVASRFRSISGMKYAVQAGLESLEASRLALVERILDVDKTMEEPRDEDISRVRYCRYRRSCQDNRVKGPSCVSCELDNLFEVYKARLFFCKKEGQGGESEVGTTEEAIELQNKGSALNHYLFGLSDSNNDSSSPAVRSEQNKTQRDVRKKIVVHLSPSELEIVLGVLKTFSKAWLEKDGLLASTKHLVLFEVMRKEYPSARFLANAQVQVLSAHDELKQATSRLRLRESDNEISIDTLSPEGLVTADMENSSQKFTSLSLLSRIRGQHRYLKGLVLSKLKSNLESSSMHVGTSHTGGLDGKINDEACPVCHENFRNQKMVFQCGHVTCCKCLVAMIEQRSFPHQNGKDNWVMCPTCRQHSDFRNIACADDRQNTSHCQDHNNPEASVTVQGSYGTKIEAVTRRILWIKCSDPAAKVLVFSNWNDVLDVLEHALLANHVSYLRMKGGRKAHVAITRFKGNNEQVMLLLVQHGANGLNLLEAKHVILVEPLLNPAAEAQAINRVHRIGQDKKTFVHRFMVKDSVEESIYKLNKSRTSSRAIISGNTKNQDQPILTIKDVESLFASATSDIPLEHEKVPMENLTHLPPSVAAALAAERRWKGDLA